jgi:xanthine dehydrogenase accessory factor
VKVLEQAAEKLRRGEPFALATVVWRQGPSSGKQGSQAIITADGELCGWIGGACAEPVVVREARQSIADGVARLLLLGTPEQFGSTVAEGMTVVPISCQSEGALEVYIEPVLPAPRLVIVGTSPMTRTLAELAQALDWSVDVVPGTDFTTAHANDTAMVVIATQGHDDEAAVERAVAARPAYLGLVASRRRAEAVLGYLAERGVPAGQLARVHAPAGLDLGETTHEEIAVAILAELVKLRARGAVVPHPERALVPPEAPVTAIDPVCGMAVTAGQAAHPLTREGVTYYFCCAGCRRAFAASKGDESLAGGGTH